MRLSTNFLSITPPTTHSLLSTVHSPLPTNRRFTCTSAIILDDAKSIRPHTLAIIDAGKSPELRLTYKEWNRRVNRLANWLKETVGVGYRDRVAILAQDGIEHLDLFHACSKLGAIHTALNWRLHWRELVAIIEDTQPKAIIYSDKFKEQSG